MCVRGFSRFSLMFKGSSGVMRCSGYSVIFLGVEVYSKMLKDVQCSVFKVFSFFRDVQGFFRFSGLSGVLENV